MRIRRRRASPRTFFAPCGALPPLAAELVEKGVEALSHRGELWTERNVAERLSVRDAMTELRAMGVMTGGPPAYDNKAKQAFANAFDRWLAKHTG